MANLETLELTITANAEKARKGVDDLINSLSKLSVAIIKPYSDLVDFNKELEKLSKYGKIKLSITGGIGGAAGGGATGGRAVVNQIRKQTTALQEQIDTITGVNRVRKNARESGLWLDKALSRKEADSRVAKAERPGEAVPPYVPEDPARIAYRIAGMRKQDEATRKWLAEAQAKEEAERAARIARPTYGPLENPNDPIARAVLAQEMARASRSRRGASVGQAVMDGNAAGPGGALGEVKNLGGAAKEATPAVEELKNTAAEMTGETTALKKSTKGLSDGTEELGNSAKKTAKEMGKLDNAVSRTHKNTRTLWHTVARIAKTMLIRGALRGLGKAFQEGRKNLYEWSKGINGEYAKAMDGANARLLQLKNSVGAAVAPLIQAALPLFHSLASAAVTALNFVNQLFSLLTGKNSWTKATYDVQEYGDAIKGAGKAADSWLASFDELNVMTQSGGGGTAAQTKEEYSDMFQEMTTFEKGAREFVTWLNENLGLVLATVGEIGLAIAGWKLATGMEGFISTLGGWIATGAVVALTVTADWALTNKYLDTGEPGWLIASALTSAVGSTVAWAVAKKFIGGNAGAYAASITLALSAIADIAALLGHTDVSALSEENIATSVVAALKAGAAAGIIAHITGHSLTTSLMTAGAVALATLGVTIGIKATLGVVQTGEITAETIKADVISALSIGGAATLLGLVKGATLGTALGGGAVAALATMGVLLSVQTFISAKSSKEIKTEELTRLGLSSLSMGLAAGLAAKLFTGATGAAAFGFGAAATAVTALTSVGVLVGIKATAQAKAAGEITQDVLKQDALSSILIGAGVGIALGVAGAGVLAVLAAAGGAALVTFGILVDLQATRSKHVQGLQHGELELAKEEIEQVVNDQMFSINAKATVESIDLSISNLVATREKVSTDLNNLLGEIKIFRLGISGETTAESLKEKVMTLVADVNKLVAAEQEHLKITFASINVLDGNGNDITSETLASAITGWNEVEAGFNRLGQKISDELSKGYTNGVANFDEELVKEMLTEIEQASMALSKAKIVGPALTNFELDLSKLTKGSSKEVIDKFTEMKNEIATAYENSLRESVSSLNTLAEYYYSQDNPEMGDHYKKMAEEVQAGMQASIDKAVKAASEPGEQAIRKWLQDSINDGTSDGIDLTDVKVEIGGYLDLAINDAIADATGDKHIIDVATAIGLTGWDLLSTKAKNDLVDQLGGIDDPGTIKRLKDELNLKVTDILAVSDFANLTSGQRTALIDALKEAYGADDTISGLRDNIKNISVGGILTMSGWEDFTAGQKQEMIDALVKSYGSEEVKNEAAKIGMDITTELDNTFKNNTPVVDVNAKWDDKKGPSKLIEGVKGQEAELPTKAVWATDKSGNSMGGKALADKINNMPDKELPTLKSKAKFKDGSGPSKLKKDIEGMKKPPVVKANAKMGDGQVKGLKDDIEGTKPTIGVKATVENKNDFIGSVTKMFTDAIDKVKTTADKWKKDYLAFLPGRAAGGVVNSGQLFVARENGIPEMVGSFGNVTGVANNDQIVAGISKGVAQAQGEQNALLRRQNELLMQILQKTGNGSIGPSSALGRVVSQSLNMYAQTAGV